MRSEVPQDVFECRQCGQCCQGRGGIILSPRDLARLARFMGLTEAEVAGRYASVSNGKLKLATGEHGFCVFFEHGAGCAVHDGKPDICRAWPYFRGNLEDPASLFMAKDFCPGIRADATFAEFVEAGLQYLQSGGLMANDCATSANALVVGHLLPKTAEKG